MKKMRDNSVCMCIILHLHVCLCVCAHASCIAIQLPTAQACMSAVSK